jgi:hypothetical protein
MPRADSCRYAPDMVVANPKGVGTLVHVRLAFGVYWPTLYIDPESYPKPVHVPVSHKTTLWLCRSSTVGGCVHSRDGADSEERCNGQCLIHHVERPDTDELAR